MKSLIKPAVLALLLLLLLIPLVMIEDKVREWSSNRDAVRADIAQAFSILTEFNLRGIEQFLAAPVGFDNQINLTATWFHPSFIGHFLPLEREINDDGFQAAWSVSSFAASISLERESAGQNAAFTSLANPNTVGVRLFEPVVCDRATKYGLLFAVLAGIMLITRRIDWYRLTPDVRMPGGHKPSQTSARGEIS